MRRTAPVLAAVMLAVPAPALAAGGDVGEAASVSAPISAASSFAFFESRSATRPKAYWNPCQTIRFAIDPSHARDAGMRPAWEIARWRSAVAEAASAMGVRMTYVGRVHTRAAKGRPARVPGVDIVITYGSARHSGAAGYGAALAGSTAGVAGVQWAPARRGNHRITSGYVVIDAKEAVAHTSTWTAPFDGRPVGQRASDPLRALYLHEFGHALGLEHVKDKGQIMYPTVSANRPDMLGSGDRAGLRALGSQRCF
jgi:hypothetical protein